MSTTPPPSSAHDGGADEASPLESSRLVHDVLYAMSMYFAESLKITLLRSSERMYIFLVLLLTMFVQIHFETYLRSRPGRHTAMRNVIHHFVFTISRTLAFLILSFALAMLDEESTTVDVFWMQGFFFPCTVIFIAACFTELGNTAGSRKP